MADNLTRILDAAVAYLATRDFYDASDEGEEDGMEGPLAAAFDKAYDELKEATGLEFCAEPDDVAELIVQLLA